MYNTITKTSTYTVTDIKKTFEGFSADFRMIAARTGKMTTTEVESYLYDIMSWAESKFISYIDLTLVNSIDTPLKATRYTVDENGNANQSERPGSNDWQNISNTVLKVIIQLNDSWNKLTLEEQNSWKTIKKFQKSWGNSTIDNSYTHLSKQAAQLYASNGYELKKENYK